MNAFFKVQFNYCPLVWMFRGHELNNEINRLHERCLRLSNEEHKTSFDKLLEMGNIILVHYNNLRYLAVQLFVSVKWHLLM